MTDDAARCPCLSGLSYGDCCARLHRGELAAATAEQLMRSRYSAFALGVAAYLLRSWHPSSRPAVLELEEEQQWRRLDILRTRAGGPFDVEARWRSGRFGLHPVAERGLSPASLGL